MRKPLIFVLALVMLPCAALAESDGPTVVADDLGQVYLPGAFDMEPSSPVPGDDPAVEELFIQPISPAASCIPLGEPCFSSGDCLDVCGGWSEGCMCISHMCYVCPI